jgi:hypothetical protein
MQCCNVKGCTYGIAAGSFDFVLGVGLSTGAVQSSLRAARALGLSCARSILVVKTGKEHSCPA